MRLHKILENVVEDGYTREPQIRALIEDMKASSYMAPVFDFGDIAPISLETSHEMFYYVRDLADHGMFSLPFSNMVLSYHVARQGQVSDFSFIAHDLGEEIGLLMMISSGGRVAGIGNCTIMKKSPEKGLACDDHRALISKEMAEHSRDQAARDMQEVMPSWFLSLIGLLNAKGVEQRITPPQPALNKRRIAAGKQPIGEVREILIRVDGQAYRPSGEAERGGHASPRLHWRRGHIRRLPSGEIAHVRPHLVGARVGDEEPAKSNYRVTA